MKFLVKASLVLFFWCMAWSMAATHTVSNATELQAALADAVVGTIIELKSASYGTLSGSNFDIIPSSNAIDGVIGIVPASTAVYIDLATIVRFNTNGSIDAHNGSSYQAYTIIQYQADVNHNMRMFIDVPNKIYTVWATQEGQSEITLASNYAFTQSSRHEYRNKN